MNEITNDTPRARASRENGGRGGRPPKPGETMEMMTLRLPAELRAWVQSQGGSAYVRRLIALARTDGRST